MCTVDFIEKLKAVRCKHRSLMKLLIDGIKTRNVTYKLKPLHSSTKSYKQLEAISLYVTYDATIMLLLEK